MGGRAGTAGGRGSGTDCGGGKSAADAVGGAGIVEVGKIISGGDGGGTDALVSVVGSSKRSPFLVPQVGHVHS